MTAPNPSGSADCRAAAAGATLTIDLGALVDNYRTLGALAAPAACAGVVKADAYGLGVALVVPALHAVGCRTFFVAHFDEAAQVLAVLRGPAALYVLNGLPPGAEEEAAALGVRPVLNGLDQVEAWSAHARRLGRVLPAALQIDSGMARLGLAPAEVDRLAARRALFEGLRIDLVMSHLACAEAPGDPANAAQRALFDSLRARLPEAPASLANSSGILLGSAYRYDLVRPGSALYGVNPSPGSPNPMKPVVALSAKVVQVREVPAGTPVGYGHAYRTPGPARIATLSLGYADGWHRRIEGAAGWVDEVRLPFVGRVSMDSVTLDVTALPPGRLRAGDSVELIGPHQDVDALARLAGTIGYEILTSLGRRFHRIPVGSPAETSA